MFSYNCWVVLLVWRWFWEMWGTQWSLEVELLQQVLSWGTSLLWFLQGSDDDEDEEEDCTVVLFKLLCKIYMLLYLLSCTFFKLNLFICLLILITLLLSLPSPSISVFRSSLHLWLHARLKAWRLKAVPFATL